MIAQPKKMNRLKTILLLTISVMLLIFIVILIIFFQGYSRVKEKYEERISELQQRIEELSDPVAPYIEATKEVSVNFIKSEIKNIGELATIEYFYTDAGKFEDAKQLFGHDVPFSTKSFIAKWDGIIKAGINVDEIDVEINDEMKIITVHMPKAGILSHEIVSDSIETLDEKDGLFNPIEVDDVREFDAVSREMTEQHAIENGILDKAFENAKSIIEKLVNNDIVQSQGYTIQFREIED